MNPISYRSMSEGSMKEMAELLRRGARMLSESCSECGTPLFRLKSGEVICPSCNKPVKMVKEGTAEGEAAQQGGLEATIRRKVGEVQATLESEKDQAKIKEITYTLIALLDALEKAKRLGA